MVDKDKTDEELQGIVDWGQDTGGNWVFVDENNNVVEEDSDELIRLLCDEHWDGSRESGQ